MTYTYFALSGGENNVKIGRTNDVNRRMRELRGGTGDCLTPEDAYDAPGYGPKLLFAVHGNYEPWFHKFWRFYHERGEWFSYEGALYWWIQSVIEERGTNIILSDATRDEYFTGRGLPGPDEYNPWLGDDVKILKQHELDLDWAPVAVEEAEGALEVARKALSAALDDFNTAKKNLRIARAELADLQLISA